MLNRVMAYAEEHRIEKIMLNLSQMGRALYENYGFQLLSDEYVFIYTESPWRIIQFLFYIVYEVIKT